MSAKAAQIIAPIAAITLTFGARKILTRVYEKRTGSTPPDPGDLRSPLLPAIGWAVALAAVSTVIEAIITREVASAQAQAIGAVPADQNSPDAAEIA